MDLKLCSVVIYIDEDREEHNALVTYIHGAPDSKPAINLVFVAMKNGEDQYGVQKKNESSVTHYNDNSDHGRCYKLAKE